KIGHGAWLSLAIGLVISMVMLNWRRGQDIVTRNRVAQEGPLQDFLDGLCDCDPPLVRVPGVSVFLCRGRDTTPLSLRTQVEPSHTLHQKVVIATIETVSIPHVDRAESLYVEALGH